MKLDFISEQSSEFNGYWDIFTDRVGASFRYSREYLQYLKNYSKFLVEDKSFVVLHSGKPVAIAFLPIENVNGMQQVSLAGGHVFGPLCLTEKIEKQVFAEVDKMSLDNGIAKVSFALDSLSSLSKYNYNHLVKYGYIHSSKTDSLIDLNESEEVLWSNLRKGHKHAIKKCEKNKDLIVEVITSENPCYETHEEYRSFHAKNAGRETRSKESFDIQYDLLRNGKGALVVAKLKDVSVAFNYFLFNAQGAQYFSASKNEDLNVDFDAYHYLLWNGIRYLKSLGVGKLILSEPCGYNRIDGLWDTNTEKQIAIGRYKRGFGGELFFSNKGVKFFSEKLRDEELKSFLGEISAVKNI